MAGNNKSVIFGVTMAALAIIVQLVVFSFFIGPTVAIGFMAGFISLIGLMILTFFVVLIFTLLTKRKEALLAGYFDVLALLIIANLIRIGWNVLVGPRIGFVL